MIISLTFKTPDLDLIIESQVKNMYPDLDEYELEDKLAEVNQQLEKFIRYGELVTIDFDLSNNTARVKEV